MTITVSGPNNTSVDFPDGTDSDTINHVMSQVHNQVTGSASGGASDSYTDDLKAAGGSVMNEAGGLLQGVGSTLGSSTVSGAGDWLKTNAPTPSPGYQNRGGQFTQDLGNGQWSQAAGDLAHGAVAGLGNTAGVLGGFAAGGPVGAAAVAGLETEGSAANRAANGGSVTGKNLLQAAPEAATDAAITGATAGFMPEGSGVVNALKRSALMGASSGGQSAADQAIENGSVDWKQVGNAAASGAASTGLAEAPGVGRGAMGSAGNNLASRTYEPANEMEAQTWNRVADDVTAAHQDLANAGQSPTLFQAANNVKSTYRTDLQNLIGGLRERGADKDDLRTLSALVEQAGRHNNALDFSNNGLFSRIDTMDLPDMGTVNKEDIRNKLLDLNTISGQSFLKNGTGLLQQIGSGVGRYGAMVHGALTGNPIEAIVGGITGHSALGNLGARAGGAVGAIGDRILGTGAPPIALQKLAAQRYLQQRGVAPQAGGSLDLGPYSPADAGPRPTPTPNFIRPTGNNTINPAEASTPTPGFIQPNPANTINGQAPAAPVTPAPNPVSAMGAAQRLAAVRAAQAQGTPTPGFIRPQAPQQAPGTPTPGFIRPAPVQVPQGTPNPGFGRPNPIQVAQAPQQATTPNPGFMRPRPIQMGQAPDPVTGNRPDAIPVNTPIKANGAPGRVAPPLPSTLAITSPAEALQAVHQDDAMAGAPPAATAPAPSQAPAWTPGTSYLSRGIPGVSNPSQAMAHAQAAEAAGAVPQGTAAKIQAGTTLDRMTLENIKAHANGAQPNNMVDAQGNPIRSLPNFQLATKAYHDNASKMATQAMMQANSVVTPQEAVQISTAINNVKMIKGQANKLQAAHAELAKMSPQAQQIAAPFLLSDSLIKHGPQ